MAGLKVLVHQGPARIFECEEDCVRAVEARAYQAGEVLIVRNEGPVGGPGMREMLGVPAIIYGQQMGEKVALVTDGRFSGATRGMAMCRRRRRTAARSHSSATVIGSASTSPTGAWTCSPAQANWQRPPVPRHKSGLLAKYAKLVGQANLGAVTHEGGAEWPWFDH